MALKVAESRKVVSIRVDATDYDRAAAQVVAWGQAGESRAVVAANVHVTMEAHDSKEFGWIINNADMVTPDGMPLVWALKLQGIKNASRVYGPDLTLHVCDAAAKNGTPIGLYGASPESLKNFEAFLQRTYPGIQVTCAISPPFRKLSPEEDAEYVKQIADSGARILFVGLGCPKQERWIADHVGKINAVMLGVGVAFDFHAGSIAQAPRWMMRYGLEWLFRLMVEPKRLWKRYLWHNPRFVWLLCWQLLFKRRM